MLVGGGGTADSVRRLETSLELFASAKEKIDVKSAIAVQTVAKLINTPFLEFNSTNQLVLCAFLVFMPDFFGNSRAIS
jgi:hypothetical protein